MPDYTRLPIGEKSPHRINAVIEIPKDSVNKYEYDKQLHVFKLDRTLFSPVHYPGDYGFIPCTLGQDGDPLDVLVLVEGPSFPDAWIEVRPIGVLEMVDQGRKTRKFLRWRRAIRSIRKCMIIRRCSHTKQKKSNTSFPSTRPWKARIRRWPAGPMVTRRGRS